MANRRIQAEVTRIEPLDSGWRLLDTDGAAVAQAEVVVIAGGTGLDDFEQTRWLPVSGVRGQVTTIPVNERSRQLKHAVSHEAYVTPAIDGVHCAGATFSRSNRSPDMQQADQDENLERLDALLPGMFERPALLQGRTGFRAVSRDRVPVVGALPDAPAFERQYRELRHGRPNAVYEHGQYLPGLFISSAHGSRGLCSSFLSAELVASMIEGSPLPVGNAVAHHLSPARFLVRQLKRGSGVAF